MRSRHIAIQPGVFPYKPGEPLLEIHRIAALEPAVFLEQKDEDGGLLEFLKPEPDDYKGLSKTLAFLKFSPSEAETLYNVIGGTISTVAGVMSIVGAVGAVADLLTKMGILETAETAQEAALRHIGMRVEQIYGFLGAAERRGLYNEAIGWRVRTTQARSERANVRISRAPQLLDALMTRRAELDQAILTMLNLGKARIAFQRNVYGYASNTMHWIDAAKAPFMNQTSGGAVNYADQGQDLAGEIWDPAHYLDVLVSALEERVSVAVALEPAFRSTGLDRAILGEIARGMSAFVSAWRGAILVANAAAGLNGGGQLLSPFANAGDAPLGILVGAVDPVSGVAALQPTWDGFTIVKVREYLPWEAWGGVYDETYAKDPSAALAAATALQATMLDQVIKGSGLERLSRLVSRLFALASPPAGSDFVRLKNASFHRVSGPQPAGIETIDLGRFKIFAADPAKTYQASRFQQVTEKTFRVRMARRGEISQVQLGYQLRLGGVDIELCPFSTAPLAGQPARPVFPSAPIQKTFTLAVRVYDSCQTRHLSAAEEDSFERDGRVAGVERMFLNERDGQARVRVSVTFAPTVSGSMGSYAGEAVVTIRALDPEDFPDAFILGVTVLETHVGTDLQPSEVFADAMTIHMAPSVLILGMPFFVDLQDARLRMARTIKGINDRFSLSDIGVPRRPEPDPAWRVGRVAQDVEHAVRLVSAAQERHGEAVVQELERFRPPMIRG